MTIRFRICLNHLARAVFILALLLTVPCSGNDLDPVISASPSWKGFTNPDGTGLYHDILARIFQPHGIAVIHRYTNSNRGIHLIKNNLADIYTCRPDIRDFPGLVLSRYPMYCGPFFIIFKKAAIKDWQGQASLKGLRVAWQRGYYRLSDFKIRFHVMEADSGASAMEQVILGRADGYIDDMNLIRESLEAIRFPIDRHDYRIEPVGTRPYFPVFNSSPRGRAILDLYEKGIKALHRSGELRQIFKRYNQTCPEYDRSG